MSVPRIESESVGRPSRGLVTVVISKSVCRYMPDRQNLETVHWISNSLRYLLVFSSLHLKLHKSQLVGLSIAAKGDALI